MRRVSMSAGRSPTALTGEDSPWTVSPDGKRRLPQVLVGANLHHLIHWPTQLPAVVVRRS
jgi:hypothetical protein